MSVTRVEQGSGKRWGKRDNRAQIIQSFIDHGKDLAFILTEIRILSKVIEWYNISSDWKKAKGETVYIHTFNFMRNNWQI